MAAPVVGHRGRGSHTRRESAYQRYCQRDRQQTGGDEEEAAKGHAAESVHQGKDDSSDCQA